MLLSPTESLPDDGADGAHAPGAHAPGAHGHDAHGHGAHANPSPPPPRSVDELDDEIVRLSLTINAATYRLLVLLREFDDRLGWSKWSFQNGSEWLAWRCGLSLSAAREKLRTAHALRRLPKVSKAFAQGRLSYSKVRALTRVVVPHDEDRLLDYALDASAAQVEERCRQIRNVAADATDMALRAWERRSLTVSRNLAAGTMIITLEVPAEDGELLVKAVDRAVESGEAELGPEFAANGWQAQQADALLAVARSYLSRGKTETCANGATTATSVADNYQVVVHVDESALRGGVGRSDLPLETMRRLSCDGSLISVVDDGQGHPLALGRKQRTVSPALRRALWSRDRGCSFPGCHRRRYVDAHHIEHWSRGGETNLDNLVLLCTQHHRLMHEGSYSVYRDVDGAICFARPDGRVIPRGGYRREDVCDDLVDGEPPRPSAEVRERPGIYAIRPRSTRPGYRPSLTSTRRFSPRPGVSIPGPSADRASTRPAPSTQRSRRGD